MTQLDQTQKKKNRIAINGILLLDKPLGMSSNQALQRAKYLLNAKKAGHTGSLDPLATGMLPLCFGEATKFSQYLLNADKYYIVTAKLGAETTTGDAEGEISQSCEHTSRHSEKIRDIISSFLGDSTQIPPMYSALKFQGQPLYKLAREGIEIERAARPITIHQINNIVVDDHTMSFAVHCSKGTYIRTLVEDIAKRAGTFAHITMLRRTGVGALPNQLINLDALEQSPQKTVLIPVEHALAHFPEIHLMEADQKKLQTGGRVTTSEITFEGLVRLYNQAQQFFGLGEIKNGSIQSVRLIATNS